MSKTGRFFVLALAAGLLVFGCGQAQPQGAGATKAAVVDLDAVAKALGRDEVMSKQIESANQQLLAQRSKLAKDMKTQLEAAKAKAGEKPTPQQETELEQMALRANAQMQSINLQVQQKSQQVRAALIQQFREEVQPYAERIARGRGAGIIFTRNDGMLWFDPLLEITPEVITQMRAAMPPATASAPAAIAPAGPAAAPPATAPATAPAAPGPKK